MTDSANQNKDRYSKILDSIEDGYYEVDLAGNLIFFNDSLCRIYGYSRSELMGVNNREYMSEEDAKKTYAIFNKVFKTGEPTKIYDWEFIKKDRSTAYIEISVSLIKSNEGKAEGFRGVVRDISARKSAEIRLQKAHDELERRVEQRTRELLKTNEQLKMEINERKLKEVKLKRSEEQYRRLADNIVDTIWEFDLKTLQFTYVNPSYEHTSGFSDQEIKNSPLEDLFTPESYKIVSNEISQALIEEKAGIAKHRQLELEVRHKDGSTFWAEIFARFVRDSEGRPYGIVGVARDISERKLAQDALRESETKNRSLIDASPVCTKIIGIDSVLNFISPAGLKMLGIKDKESVVRTIYPPPFFPNETNMILTEKLEKAKIGETSTVEVEARDINGNIVWFDTTFIPVRDKNDSVEYIIAVSIDITERKKAEEALSAYHEKFLKVLNSIDATIYVADMDTHEILFMNKHMIEDFGMDMTGKICWDVFRGESGPCSHCTNNQLVDTTGNPTGVYIWQGKNPITHKWYTNYDRAIEWTDGRLVRLQIATDITEYKRMKEELSQSQKMEAIGTLAGGIAHEFNNILGIIIGNTELALGDIPEWNPAQKNLDEIKTAGLRAKDIVSQLLNFSRKTELDRMPIKIIPIIKESLKLLRATIPSTVDIRSNIAHDITPIMANPIQIQQVIINLCTNAGQAMEMEGGVLEVSLAQVQLDTKPLNSYGEIIPGQHIQLTVSDTGHGIAPELQDRIFDPFFTTKEVGKGSGMGLAIVHGILTNHDGAISVTSEPGIGTKVNVFFPVCEEEPEKGKEYTDNLPLGNERILFVDDEKSIVLMAGKMLKRLGYKVKSKTNPLEALAMFQSNPNAFDLIITDMTMPGLNGVKFSEKLKEIRANIPIIICTGYSQLIDEYKVKQLEISDYVMKPIEMAQIAKTIRNVLDNSIRESQ